MFYDYLDLDRLFRTVYGEARNQGREGMLAVAYVVCNRAKIAACYQLIHHHNHPLFGSGTPASACTGLYQFSCWNLGDPNLSVIVALKEDDPKVQPMIQAAKVAMEETEPDPTSGATHYHADSITPPWAIGHEPIAIIGQHLFYRFKEDEV